MQLTIEEIPVRIPARPGGKSVATLIYLVPCDDVGNMEPVRAFVVEQIIGLTGLSVDDDTARKVSSLILYRLIGFPPGLAGILTGISSMVNCIGCV